MTCSTKAAHLALAEGGIIIDAAPLRLDVATQYESTKELEATLAEATRALASLRPDRVSVLQPEHNPRFKRTYGEWMPRVALETVIRLACLERKIPVELVPRPTVRARLGLDRAGDLASQVPAVVAEPIGKYWSAGRDIAALAALAGERV